MFLVHFIGIKNVYQSSNVIFPFLTVVLLLPQHNNTEGLKILFFPEKSRAREKEMSFVLFSILVPFFANNPHRHDDDT